MKRKNKLPEFRNLKEIADFWDEHDFSEYEHEFMEISNLKFNIKNHCYLPISLEMYERMEVIASSRSVSVEKLMRTWIEEKLTDSVTN